MGECWGGGDSAVLGSRFLRKNFNGFVFPLKIKKFKFGFKNSILLFKNIDSNHFINNIIMLSLESIFNLRYEFQNFLGF